MRFFNGKRSLFLTLVLLATAMFSMFLSACGQNVIVVRNGTHQTIIAVNEDCTDDSDGEETVTTYTGDKITQEMVLACKNRQEYYDLVMPCYQYWCKQYGLKYPGILASQVFIEIGGSISNWSSVWCFRECNNMGGLFGDNGEYARYASIDEYIKAHCETIGTGTAHKNTRSQQDPERFANALTWSWVTGPYRNGAMLDEKAMGDSPADHYDGGAACNGQLYVDVIYRDGYLGYHLDKFDVKANTSTKARNYMNSTNGGTENTSTPSSTVSLHGDTIEEQVWNHFKTAGYSDAATAGIMGNMYQESGVRPEVIQDGGNGPAAGICQWESYTSQSGRWKAMADFAAGLGKDWTDLEAQLRFLTEREIKEQFDAFGNNAPGYETFDKFKTITDVHTATRVFHDVFERSSDTNLQNRYAAADRYYSQFQGTTINEETIRNDNCVQLAEAGYDNELAANAENVFFSQLASTGTEWVGLPYGDGTVASAGCGLCTATHCINIVTGKNYTPKDVYMMRKGYGIDQTKWGYVAGADWNHNYPEVAEMNRELFGVKAECIAGASIERYKQELQAGHPIQFCGGDCMMLDAQGNQHWHEGHFICFYKYDGTYFYAKDSSLPTAELGNKIKYSEEQMAELLRHGSSWEIWAISKV